MGMEFHGRLMLQVCRDHLYYLRHPHRRHRYRPSGRDRPQANRVCQGGPLHRDGRGQDRLLQPPTDGDAGLLGEGAQEGQAADSTFRHVMSRPHLCASTPAQMDVMDLIPAPYGPMHVQWLRQRSTTSSRATSCRMGRVVNLLHRTGRLIPVTLSIRGGDSMAGSDGRRDQNTSEVYSVRATLSAVEDAAQACRMDLQVDAALVVRRSTCGNRSFGYHSGQLDGQHLHTLVEGR